MSEWVSGSSIHRRALDKGNAVLQWMRGCYTTRFRDHVLTLGPDVLRQRQDTSARNCDGNSLQLTVS